MEKLKFICNMCHLPCRLEINTHNPEETPTYCPLGYQGYAKNKGDSEAHWEKA